MPNNAKGDRPPELVAASETTARLSGYSTVVELEVPLETRAALSQAAEDQSRPILMRVEDIEVDAPPGVSYNVFLHDPVETAVDTRAYLGTVTFFGIELRDEINHEMAPGFRKVFNASTAIANNRHLVADREVIHVVFVPTLLGSTPDTEEARVVEEQLRNIDRVNVRVGRVSLYLG